MEDTAQHTNYKYLRNPLLVFAVFMIIILPDFLVFCGLELPFSSVLLGDSAESCPNAFVSDLFIEQSVLSLLLVIVVFEALILLQQPLKLTLLPRDIKQIASFEAKVLVAILAGSLTYVLIRTFVVSIGSDAEGLSLAEWNVLPTGELGRMIVIATLLVNVQLVTFKRKTLADPITLDTLEAEGKLGKCTLRATDVLWFEKRGRYYYANTQQDSYRVDFNLQQLEAQLDPALFSRANRAVIVNHHYIQSHAYWENEKYILVTKGKEEFVVSRQRMKVVREKLKPING